GRGVAADHRVAGIDHLVGFVAHLERLDLPPEHVAVEHLCPLGVLGNQLEPHEFSWKRLAIGHGVFSLHPNVERAPPGSTSRPTRSRPSWRAGPIASPPGRPRAKPVAVRCTVSDSAAGAGWCRSYPGRGPFWGTGPPRNGALRYPPRTISY